MFFKLFQKMILIQYTYKYNYLRNFNKNIIIIIQYYKSQFKYYRFLTQKRKKKRAIFSRIYTCKKIRWAVKKSERSVIKTNYQQ